MKGITYFKRWGFSINEGALPNLTIIWGGTIGPFFYIALTRRIKWHWAWPRCYWNKDRLATPDFILRAVPTCTLWEQDDYGHYFRFRFWPAWRVSYLSIVEAR
jgi:hypothetical protein